MAVGLTVLSLHERDITAEVCQRCARCCQIEIKVSTTDSRYRRFLRGVGLSLTPAVVADSDDCCDQVHDVTVQLGACKHLQTEEFDGETRYLCALYEDPRRPELCEHYNCVSWAKHENRYDLRNPMLTAAQEAWQRVHAGELRPEELLVGKACVDEA